MEILRSLARHGNIVSLRYYVAEPDIEHEDNRLLYLFLEYLPADLQLVIRNYSSGMPLSLIQIYAKQLLQGLAHLSSQKVVHRDILPRNILIDPSTQTLKLADFGSAKIVAPDIPNHPKVGTFQYRAMELLLGATLYDSKAGKAFQFCTYGKISGRQEWWCWK
jgi:serine/threonine protein kinase